MTQPATGEGDFLRGGFFFGFSGRDAAGFGLVFILLPSLKGFYSM
jgi:hypothetical protein